jgi:hypothetical protein
MSTTFGIKIVGSKEPIKIAHRSNIGKGKIKIKILDPIVYKLQRKCKLIALDNGNQGIETIGDLLDKIEEIKLTNQTNENIY